MRVIIFGVLLSSIFLFYCVASVPLPGEGDRFSILALWVSKALILCLAACDLIAVLNYFKIL